MRATFASQNPHKARELEQLLPGWTIETLDADDYPEETGETYYDNALLKAGFGWERAGGWTIGEDSGIEVATLDGRPGIHSARWAGHSWVVGAWAVVVVVEAVGVGLLSAVAAASM